MAFSDELRRKAQPIWNAQLKHPFVLALGKGTLPERKFKYYILQDARFLGDLARVFAAGAERAPDAESALRFAKLIEETIITERGLHESYGKRWKMTPKVTPARSHASIIRSASSKRAAIGFSQRTCTPASAAATTASAWAGCGVQTSTASTMPLRTSAVAFVKTCGTL
ncbi:MAG: hypothetical protein C4294_09140 [Nitrospiraceae bacterium]